VTRNYWWPGVTRDVGKYVEGCDLYQRMKNRTEELAGKLKLSEVPQKTWTHLTVDFITKLPVVAGKDAILVVCDRLSKMWQQRREHRRRDWQDYSGIMYGNYTDYRRVWCWIEDCSLWRN